MASIVKSVDNYAWYIVNGKTMIVISDNWKGSPIIACYVDVVVISEDCYKRNKSNFVGNACKARFVFM